MKTDLNKIITEGNPLTKNRNILEAWQNKAPPPAPKGGSSEAFCSTVNAHWAQVKINFSSAADTSQGNTTNN